MEKKKDKFVILFLDTGGNCRCPMAQGFMHKLLHERNITHVEVRTAGVMTPTGLLPAQEAKQLLQEEGVDISRHRSRPLSEALIREADLILGMTPFHIQSAFRKCEEARGKTFLLREYVGAEGKNTQIADPMGGTLEIFKKCFSQIRHALHALVEKEPIKTSPFKPEPKPEPRAEPKAEHRADHKKPAKKHAPPQGKPAKSKHKPATKPAPKAVAKAKAKPAPKAAKASVKPKAKPKAKAKPAPKPKSKPAAKPAPKATAKTKPAAKKHAPSKKGK